GEVVLPVQFGDVLGDDHALGVLPRALANAVARVDRARPLRAEIRLPVLVAEPRRLRQVLAVLIGAGQTTEIAALARAGAGDEDRRFRLLGVRHAREREERD